MLIKRVIFIRPGETEWNRQERWQGWVAVPLNDHGQQQAQRLANFLRNTGMRALYSSDLRRATQTADILAETMGYAPVLDRRLRERNMGQWQGLTRAEIKAWYPEEYQQLLADRENFIVPGGESLRQVAERVRAAFDEIQQQDAGDTIGIVSHTTAVRVLLGDLVPDCEPDAMKFSNISVTSISREGDGPWKLIRSNDISHLEGMKTQSFGEIIEDES